MRIFASLRLNGKVIGQNQVRRISAAFCTEQDTKRCVESCAVVTMNCCVLAKELLVLALVRK